MAAKFLEDYIKVDDLITKLNENNPDARLVTELETMVGDVVIFKASLYLDDSDVVKCTGYGAENINREKKLEKAESVARGRCLRVFFGAEPTQEEMEDIARNKANTPKKSSKSTLDTKVEELVEEGLVKDLSNKQQSIINNVKNFAFEITNKNEHNAKSFYAQALGEMGMKENELSVNNMDSVKNKIQDLVTLSQVDKDKGE
tara:strand:+ start:1085 stop:1690 length:606 start_codon:yes stop_codon:yes gene_type:complete